MILQFYYNTNNYVDITCNVVYGSGFFDQRLNHYSVRTTDGTRHCSDLGPTLCLVSILAKNISTEDKEALDDWLHNVVKYTQRAFTINQFKSSDVPFPLGAGVDLGLGPGMPITGVHYTINNTEGVFTKVPPGQWDLKLENLEFLR